MHPFNLDPDSLIHLPQPGDNPFPLTEWFPAYTGIELDIGCGKGRFLEARAKAHPETGLVGIDRMLKRLRKVDRRLRRTGCQNVRLIRADADYTVTYLIPTGTISTGFIYFPDPWPKRRHHSRRLFSPAFVDALFRILTASGIIHVATDHEDYFRWITGTMHPDDRFIEIPPYRPNPDEQTDFERQFIQEQRPVYRYSFQKRLIDAIPPPHTP